MKRRSTRTRGKRADSKQQPAPPHSKGEWSLDDWIARANSNSKTLDRILDQPKH